jgi:hypothetical protein
MFVPLRCGRVPYDTPVKKNMRIMTVNCRSIKDKRAEFETAPHYHKPDIICATEL